MMNVNRVYVAQIFVNSKCEVEDDLTISREGTYVKSVIVYRKRNGKYVDFVSGEVYKTNMDDISVGDMYINFECGLIPINQIFNVNFDKENVSKKRILKTLSNSMLLNNKKEDDK